MRGLIRLIVLAGLALSVTYGGATVLGQSGPCYDAGCLDPTFATNGMATAPALAGGAFTDIGEMALQKVNGEDRIVAVGTVVGTAAAWTVARFLPSGALDTTFGANGIVKRTFPNASASWAHHVVVQPDQKILVLGDYRPTKPRGSPEVWVVTRYQPDGKSYDTSFGTGGTVILAPPAGALPLYVCGDLTLQGDKILVACSSYSDADLTTAPYIDIHVVRLESNGRFDNSFGPDANTPFATLRDAGRPQAIMVQKVPVSQTAVEDRIVLAVWILSHDPGQPYYRTAVVRLTPDGAPDMSFADSGVAEMKVPGATETIFNGIALDGSNRIIAAGYWYLDQPHPIMARYLLDGSLDPTFAAGGVLQQDSWNGHLTDVAIQPDDKILALADLSGAKGTTPWRVTEDGWPDATFGVGGSATHTLPTSGVLLLVRRPDDGFGTDAFIVGGVLRLGTGKATTFQWTLWRYFY